MESKLIFKVIEQVSWDRLIYLTYRDEEVVGINYHQGTCDMIESYRDTPCPHITAIYEKLVWYERNWSGSAKRTEEERVVKAIDLYRKAFNSDLFEEENEDVKADVLRLSTQLFEEAIELTGTYFLSDYIDMEIHEHLDKEKADEIVARRNRLRAKCNAVGLDFHGISQDVAQKWMNKMNEIHIESDEEYTERVAAIQDTTLTIPKGQTDVIRKALDFYVEFNKRLNSLPTDSEAYELFDMKQLSAMMNYKVTVSLDENEEGRFTSTHGIDLPIYC